MRRLFLFAALLALIAGGSPALAQGAAWSVDLFDGATGSIIRVGLDGSTVSFNLNLPPDTLVSAFDMAFSPDGSRAAYCLMAYDGVQPRGQARLIVRDLAAGVNLVETDLGLAIGCRTGQDAYRTDGAQFAVSTINFFPNDPAKPANEPMWRLQVRNADTGALVRELTELSPAVSSAGLVIPSGAVLPYVQLFDSERLIFAEVPYGVGGGAEWAAFLWRQADDSVIKVSHWGHIGLDLLPGTGEMLFSVADGTRPAATPIGPFPEFNTLMLVEASGQMRPIYYSAEYSVMSGVFINDGQQAAVILQPGYDPNQPPDQPYINRYIALDRAGNETLLFESAQYATLIPAPGGFAYLMQTFTDNTFTTWVWDLNWVVGGQTTLLWTSGPQQTAYYEIARYTPPTAAPNLPPFPDTTAG